MPNQHATPMVAWHPKPPGTAEWIRAEAERRGLKLNQLMDEVIADYRSQQDSTTTPDPKEQD